MLGLRGNVLDAPTVAAVRKAGLGIGGWACNDAALIAKMFDLGVDVFTTDRPDLALAVARQAMKDHPAAYQANEGSALTVDKAFYQRIAEAAGRKLVEQFTIPIRTGRAWKVPAGHVFRIVTVEGPQVGDLNIWNAHNPRERLWASRTRQLQAAHVTVFDRLWSTLPYLRPIATITSDSLKDYGIDEFGGRIHDLLGTRCDPYVNRMLTGQDFDLHCHSNLVRAVAPHGLTELDVHDVLNVFQCTGLNHADKYFMRASPAKQGDHHRVLRRDRSPVRALDLSRRRSLGAAVGPRRADPLDGLPAARHRGLRARPALLDGWKPPQSPPYKGAHG